MSDGVFTPAVSVLSAVGGIAVAKPSVTENVVPISIVNHFSVDPIQLIFLDRLLSLYGILG